MNYDARKQHFIYVTNSMKNPHPSHVSDSSISTVNMENLFKVS